MIRTDLTGEHFDSVLDVGGNVGDFAELARSAWPDARITSFEPVPILAKANRERANGRWWVEEVAISSTVGTSTLHYCENQHSASTMQAPGSVRYEHFGIRDRFVDIEVKTQVLDAYLADVQGSCLLKVDVEGHEQNVLRGASSVLDTVECVIIEIQNDPLIFRGSAPCGWVDHCLHDQHGLSFVGVVGCLSAPGGRILQFDGVWRR